MSVFTFRDDGTVRVDYPDSFYWEYEYTFDGFELESFGENYLDSDGNHVDLSEADWVCTMLAHGTLSDKDHISGEIIQTYHTPDYSESNTIYSTAELVRRLDR